MKATYIPNAEFKSIILRMLKNLQGKRDDLNENLK